MKPAIIVLTELLKNIGLSNDEICILLGRFLKEESKEYLSFLNNKK